MAEAPQAADAPVCVVVGVGPGMGEALARAFAGARWRVALMSRSEDKLRPLAQELGGVAISCDATREDNIRQAMDRVRAELGPVHTLIWNVGNATWGDLDKLDMGGMNLAWQTNASGLFVGAQAVVADMRAAESGNILVTGATASRRGKPFTTAFAAGKAAQRSLCQSLARQLWPEGIHVALVILDGMVNIPDREVPEPRREPAAAAVTYLHLAQQPRSAWTFELEVRPSAESW